MKRSPMPADPELRSYLKDLRLLFSVPTQHKYSQLALAESPFDLQLLTLSRIYRISRKHYFALGGTYSPRVCSTMRSLSAQDIFKDEIDYSPSHTEIEWFKDQVHTVAYPSDMMRALVSFNEISLFHEQNHRILWRLLPPAPEERADFCRYLNFAESLVVTLDMALGDELGPKYSHALERVKTIYHPGGEDSWHKQSKKEYRGYLFGILAATYLCLELRQPHDIPKAVEYILPDQRKKLKSGVRRAVSLSPLFAVITNQEWQKLHWRHAQRSLATIHQTSVFGSDPLYLPEDPLDLEEEFIHASRIFDYFGL